MLSRTAENLYWLARYMERAETMARLLEVGYRMALMPSAGEGYRNEWASLVAAAGSSAGFEAKFGEELPPARRRDLAVLRPREPVERHLVHRDRAAERPRRAHRADHRDVGRAERRLSRAPRHRAAAALGGAAAAALRLDQAAGRAAPRRDRGHAPPERRLRLPQHRLLPRARRQHRAAARRQVLRPAADHRHGRRHRSTPTSGRRCSGRCRPSGPSTGPTGASTARARSPTS